MSKDKESDFSYDEAMKKLEQIVSKLENGNNTLDENIKLYEDGVKLCNLCKKELDNAVIKIKQYNGE